MLKFHAALIFVLTAASLAFAMPVRQESYDWELMARLCGRLEHIDHIADKLNPIKFSEKATPIKDVRLVAYERRGNIPYGKTDPIAAETRSSKSGSFEFKTLLSGNYWFVAIVDRQEYSIPIIVKHTQDKLPACSENSFAIEDSGKFVLRVRAPSR